MVRRDFLKTIFATPLLGPFLFGSPSSANEELFLISDSPQTFLPILLEKVGYKNKAVGRRFAVIGDHPQKTALSHALIESGWTQTGPLQHADLSLSFRLLQRPAPPSFTLVREGKITDIRKKELLSLWKEMNEKQSVSITLTTAALRIQRPGNTHGTFVRVFHNGRLTEEAPLKKDRIQPFRAEQGEVIMKIEQGKVSVPFSSCRHKICCTAPSISSPGERIVCAPNHFFLEIGGPGTLDTIIG